MPIFATCIDSQGHFTNEVLRFCKERADRRIWPIKGRGGADVDFIRNPTRNNRVRADQFVLGVDAGKNMVLDRLRIILKGPGYCHFPAAEDAGYTENYFAGLTAEHKVIRYKNGRRVEVWELKDPKFKRNEPFDIRNYNLAAIEITRPPGLEVPGEEPQHPQPVPQRGRRRLSGGI